LISLFICTYVPELDGKGPRALGELYERRIHMTIEQAEGLVQMLIESIQAFKARKSGAEEVSKAE
jgi:hypothetical protein